MKLSNPQLTPLHPGCNRELQRIGADAMPRTCADCGLGPCKYEVSGDPLTVEQTVPFIRALVALCHEYRATLFPRKGSNRQYVSVELDGTPRPLWLDFTRIDAAGAHGVDVTDITAPTTKPTYTVTISHPVPAPGHYRSPSVFHRCTFPEIVGKMLKFESEAALLGFFTKDISYFKVDRE